jgi:hypothetical protein
MFPMIKKNIHIKLTFILFAALMIISCGGAPEPDLRLSNGEAFGFDLGESWEINASVKAEGFLQKEIEDGYQLHISYNVDLVTPQNDSLVSVYSNSVNETDPEEFMDFILEAQLEVDNNFGDGLYKVVFNVIDEYSKQTKTLSVDFNLSK